MRTSGELALNVVGSGGLNRHVLNTSN